MGAHLLTSPQEIKYHAFFLEGASHVLAFYLLQPERFRDDSERVRMPPFGSRY